ncbi:Gfo/Idh/MocA family protein [Neobacillus dielmonensis]|uniref:Gfo/Idh/MocA family protein n=1 Tax=Neobacillus dielmonensis TaxID=1347369 RepID=UPI0005AA0CAB|nr:Gfo/Idh/MocA family oxidoreductase [Neobacillus dielmonensis]
MRKLKIGVIGGGSISDLHLDSYSINEQAEIIAICDLNSERSKQKAERYGAQYTYSSYKELLANPEVEAVSICTWNHTHAEISMAALQAGKHVLVEKPLCTTVKDALQVEQIVKETGKLLQVGFVRRYGSNTNILKQFIDHDELGEIYYAKASCLRRLGNPGGWFSDKERSGGGPLIDLGVHVIDLCWYLMGRPKVKSVSGNTYNKLGNRANVQNLSYYKAADFDASNNTVEDLAIALIRFENGASLMVDVSFTLHAKQDEMSVKLYGDKGGAEIEPELLIVSEKYDTVVNLTPQVDMLTFDFVKGFQAEIDHFVDCCLTGKETISPVEDGVEIMKILCGIYESSQKGMEITF